MKNRTTYSYSILRYVHDIASGEFINVGVALHSSESRYFRVLCRKTLGRVSDTFPDIRVSSFKSLIRGVTSRYEEVREAYSSPLEFNNQSTSLKELILTVLPHDDSSLVWSNVSTGLCVDPDETLKKLFVRYVSKYDQKTVRPGRSDEDVWRSFKRSLEARNLSKFFTEKVIHGEDDEVKFPLAWKNGLWHCVEPISFDLSGSESIREKAHKIVGQITSVNDSNEKFKLYLVVGKPNDRELDDAFERAVRLLEHKLPMKPEVYFEDNKEKLIDKLSAEIHAHQQKDALTNRLLN